MKIEIEWQEPILVAKRGKILFSDEDYDAVEKTPGVYFFSRKFGTDYKPFYIGETLNLNQRVGQHLDSRRIALVLMRLYDGGDKRIGQGDRYFHYGYFRKKTKNAKKCIAIVQRYMIQEALAQDLPLLNEKLTKLKTHTLEFKGGKIRRSIYKKTQMTLA